MRVRPLMVWISASRAESGAARTQQLLDRAVEGLQLLVTQTIHWGELSDEERHGAKEPTNVAKLALAVAREDGRQELFYEAGVGTAPDERMAVKV